MSDGKEDVIDAAEPLAPAPGVPGQEAMQEAITLEQYLGGAEPPYPEERAKRIQYFFKKRERAPQRFRISDTGDLEILSKDGGSVEETIPLRIYVPLDKLTMEVRDQNRLDMIGMAEAAYEDAIAAVREAQREYATSGAMQPLLAAQRAAAEADAVLSRVRYGSRSVQLMANPETRDVLFEQAKEVRKLVSGGTDPFKKKVMRLVVYEYPYGELFGQYTDAPDAVAGADVDADQEAAPADVGGMRRTLRDGRRARLFYDVDEDANAFLSPFWPVEFTMDGTRYFTAAQAFMAEWAREIGQDTLRTQLLKTRSTRTMRFLMKKATTPPKDVKGLWLRIFTAVYQQHEELKTRLLNTGTDALVYADPQKGSSGIGVGSQDAGALDPAKWTGENHLGLALETLRTQLREGTAAEAAADGAPTEAVITEQEQAAAKTAAIINAQRKRFQFKGRPT